MNNHIRYKDTMATIEEIERNKRYTSHEQEYWPKRLLLSDIAESMAIIADALTIKGDGCNDCKFVDQTTEQEPCCRCANNYQNMWSGRK